MNDENSNSILIVGTGAMACLFAARFSAASFRVTMLGTWKEGLEGLREKGVVLVESNGSESAFPVKVMNYAQASKDHRFALVLVKSWQTQRVAMQLAERLSPQGLALTLQNGIGNRELLGRYLGRNRVTLGVTTIGATLLGPGRVRQGGEGVISINGHPRIAPISRMLSEAGFKVESAPDATALLWGKLVVNAAINPITALLGISNGELLSRETARALLQAAAREAYAVAIAQGIRISYPDPVAAAESIAYRTANNRSSMLQDVQRGAPTEIDAICGAIVRAGEKTGVQTPINRDLFHRVKALHPTE
jgi:2-dehydropantoate 2-reductase